MQSDDEEADFELIVSDSGHEPFSRGISINEGVYRSKGDILVIADADVCVSSLTQAIEIAREGHWVIAHARSAYHELTPEGTRTVLGLDPRAELPSPERISWSIRVTGYSGMLVMPRSAFVTVGGFDSRFIGWGYEDNAMQFALDTLWGPRRRTDGWAYHLYHPHVESTRFGQPNIDTNKALADEYFSLLGNADLMRAMLHRRDESVL